MRRVWLVLAFALLLPAGAGAKLVGDLRMCGTRECRTIDRHLRHDTSWPLLDWESVRRLYIPITLDARRDTPWSDHKTSLWIGRRHDLLMRDGELVPVPRSLADRVRRARSLR